MKVKTALKAAHAESYLVSVEVDGSEIFFSSYPLARVWSTFYSDGKSLADFKRSTFIAAKKMAKKEMERLAA